MYSKMAKSDLIWIFVDNKTYILLFFPSIGFDLIVLPKYESYADVSGGVAFGAFRKSS